MIRIIADDNIPFLKGSCEPHAFIRYMDGREIGPSVLADADALLVRTRTRCDESLLRGSGLTFIATATIGTDHIDTNYCDAHSIRWINAPGCNAGSVQQYIASVLANLVVKKDFSLQGKKMGIIGVGNVGKKIESLARLYGMKVLLNDPPRARIEGSAGFVGLEELLAESDIVSVHVPLSRTGADKTLGLLDATFLGRIKPGAWFINTSRGEVVEGEALKSALSERRLSGAVLDVWENEPGVDLQLLERVTIATPHIAGYSTDGKRNATTRVVRELGAFFHIPLSDWSPSGIPEPSEPVITADCTGRSVEQIIAAIILHTYDVTEDDTRFRLNPGDFEKQRGIYPVRREFPAYSVRLLNGDEQVRAILRSLGFTLVGG